MPALIEAFLDPASSTYSYVVYEADGGQCAIVDPVLDSDGTLTFRNAAVESDFARPRRARAE